MCCRYDHDLGGYVVFPNAVLKSGDRVSIETLKEIRDNTANQDINTKKGINFVGVLPVSKGQVRFQGGEALLAQSSKTLRLVQLPEYSSFRFNSGMLIVSARELSST